MVLFSGTRQQPQYNRPLYGLQGRYTLSAGVTVPYFLSAMPIERAIDELKVHEQIPPNLENRWSLNELFQREVNTNRVTKELVDGYLSDPRKLKFFNALTIVLMPKTVDGKLLDAFPPPEHDPPIPYNGDDPEDKQWIDHPDAKKVVFGGVQYLTVGTHGRLRWDPERVHAVAVDGQHRLYALRLYKDEVRGRSLSPDEQQTAIPIIFVLIAPEAGFENERLGAAASIRTLSRELFTDLNKNAKKVDRARELILDDWSIEARCIRTLVTGETARDSNELLPLSLVRWQEENNRFDTGYFLNSLVHLDLLIDAVLGLEPPNPMEKEPVLEYIQELSLTLGEDGVLSDGERSLKQVYEDEYLDEEKQPIRPFTRLPAAFLEAAVEGFKKHHRPWILRVLRDFKPYRSLLEYAREHNLIEGAFGQYHAQTKSHRKLIEDLQVAGDENWYKREILDHISAIELVKGPATGSMADWSFKAIFQKALIRLARVVEFEQRGDHRLGTIDDVLHVMDQLYDKELFRVERELPGHEFGLWAFIGTNPVGGRIKVAKATEDRLLALLRLWYYANRKVAADAAAEPPKSWSSRKLLAYFATAEAESEWVDCQGAFSLLYKAMDTNVLHGKELSSVKESSRKGRVRRRLAAVLQSGVLEMGLEHDSSDDEDDQQ